MHTQNSFESCNCIIPLCVCLCVLMYLPHCVIGWSLIHYYGISSCADPEGGRVSGPPLKNHKNIGFLCNTGPDPLKNHKVTKPAFNVGPSSACQQNAISMAFHWRADDRPIKAIFGSSIPQSTKKYKKMLSNLDPL